MRGFDRGDGRTMARKAVVTVDERELGRMAAELLHRITSDGFLPDLVVGVETGGAKVLATLPESVVPRRATCSLQRSGTVAKQRVSALTRLMRRLPYRVTDEVRLLEDRWHERQPLQHRASTPTLEAQIGAIRSI